MVFELIQTVVQRHPELTLAILFGSQASGRARPHSDVDVAVLGHVPLSAEQRMSLVSELAQATGRPVDLIDMATAGEPMLGQVLSHGRRVLGSDEVYAQLLSRHLLDAADFLPYVERILADRRQAWIGS
jgi:uncharacterized protein